MIRPKETALKDGSRPPAFEIECGAVAVVAGLTDRSLTELRIYIKH